MFGADINKNQTNEKMLIVAYEGLPCACILPTKGKLNLSKMSFLKIGEFFGI